MSEHNLFIDIDRQKAVMGTDNSDLADLPVFKQEKTFTLRVWFLKNFSRISPYTQVPVSGVTLEAALGTRVGNSTLLYTQQFTWAASTDLSQPYHYAAFPMDTAAITTLLGSSEQASAWFEVNMIINGIPRPVLSELVTVFAAVIKTGAVMAPAFPTPLSAEAANATFVKPTHGGPLATPAAFTGRLRLMNENGYGTELWTDSDGTFKTDPITP